MPLYTNPDGTVSLLDPRRKTPIVLPPGAAPLLGRDTMSAPMPDVPPNPYEAAPPPPGPTAPMAPMEEGIYRSMPTDLAAPQNADSPMSGEELDAIDRLAGQYQFDAPQAAPNDHNLISQEGSGGSGPMGTEGSISPATQSPSEPGLNYTPGPAQPNQMSLTTGDEGEESSAGAPPPGPPGAPGAPGGGLSPAAQADIIADIAAKRSKMERAANTYSPGTPERWEYQSASIKKGLAPLPKDVTDPLYQAYADAHQHALDSGKYVGMLSDELALRQAKASDEARRELGDLRTKQFQQQRELDYKMSALDRRIYETRSMADENPEQTYWARKGGLGTFMTKIGIALGELGSAVLHKDNPIAKQVQDEINDEFEFQKMRLGHANQGIANQRGALAEMRANFDSVNAGDAAAKALLSESAASEIRAYAGLLQSEVQRNAAIQLADQISLDAAKFRAHSHEMESDQIALSAKHKAATAGGYGKPADYGRLVGEVSREYKVHPLVATDMISAGVIPSPYGGGKMDRAAVEREKEAINRRIVLPQDVAQEYGLPRALYTGYSGADKKKIEDTIISGAQYVKNIQRIKQLIASSHESVLGSEARAEIRTLAATNAYLTKRSVMSEALTIGERPIWSELTGEHATDFFSWESNNRKNLDVDEAQMKASIANEIGRTTIDPWSPESTVNVKPTNSKAKKKD